MQSKAMLGLALAAIAALPAAANKAAAQTSVAPTTVADVAFVEGAIETSLGGAKGDPVAGAAIMSDRASGNCVACHAIAAMPDVAFQGNIGPALDGAGSRWSEAQLRGIVSNAKMTFEDTVMPAFYKTTGYERPGDGYTGKAPTADLPPILDAQQVEDVTAYLVTLKE